MTAILSRFRTYFDRQVGEIRSDPALRIYGCALAFLQVLSAIYWLDAGTAQELARGTEAVCWPMWADCETWRILDESQIRALFVCFLIFGIGVMALFLKREAVRLAYGSLLGLNLVKLLILAMDFRLRMNHHLMAFWVTVAFLFFPRKKDAIRVLIALFYFWAGTLKLNSEWLSGSAIYGNLWLIHGGAIPWACAYVVLLELLLIWGLWLDGSWLAWATWLQLMLFHTFSFPIVGFFYPVLMIAILLIFPLSWKFPSETGLLRSLLRGKASVSVYAVAALFSAFQLQPKLMPGDTALTGEGRIFALHMFDSWTSCEVRATIKSRGGAPGAPIDLRIPLPIRLHCDPIVYLSRARRICRTESARNPGFLDLDLNIRTRRHNQLSYQPVVDISDFCAKSPKYSMLFHNDWIRAPSNP